jgi:hypothetical protein
MDFLLIFVNVTNYHTQNLHLEGIFMQADSVPENMEIPISSTYCNHIHQHGIVFGEKQNEIKREQTNSIDNVCKRIM